MLAGPKTLQGLSAVSHENRSGASFGTYFGARSEWIRPQNGLQESPTEGGALLELIRGRIPSLQAQKLIQKPAPERFSLSRNPYLHSPG